VKVSDERRKEDRPQRTENELDGNENEPDCQCPLNEGCDGPGWLVSALLFLLAYEETERQMACYFTDQALLEAV